MRKLFKKSMLDSLPIAQSAMLGRSSPWLRRVGAWRINVNIVDEEDELS